MQTITFCLGLVTRDTHDVIDCILYIIYIHKFFCFGYEHDVHKFSLFCSGVVLMIACMIFPFFLLIFRDLFLIFNFFMHKFLVLVSPSCVLVIFYTVRS